MMQQCSLLSLATAVPPHVVTQAEAKDLAREAFGGKKALFDRLSGVFDNAGIDKRHIVAPQEWYLASHGWRERNAVYLEASEKLFVEAASTAIEQRGPDPRPDRRHGGRLHHRDRDSQPRRRVASRLGLREDIRRVPVFGLGCAGGVNGLRSLRAWRPPSPERWLFVTVETCSISIRLDSDDPAAVVATALFGDGGAAAVVTSGTHSLAPSQLRRRSSGRTRFGSWAGTSRIPVLAVVFDRAIPPFIEQELAQAVDEMCAAMGVRRADIDRLCSHPGGVKVIDAIESALELPRASSTSSARFSTTTAT